MNSQEIFIGECYKELEIKQNKLNAKYKIGSYKNYLFDKYLNIIKFNNIAVKNSTNLEFDIIFIGSWDKYNKIWKWAWDELDYFPNKNNEKTNITY